jgi:flagellar basal-body rod modification protein FlgD
MNIQGFAPTMAAPVQAPNAHAVTPKTNSSSNPSSATGTSAASLQETFLNLLVTELQNQDPTAPVDPTAMVGQLVSLNQLDQLISINSTLTSLTTPASTPTSNAQAVTLNPSSPLATTSSNSSAAAAALSQIQPTNANTVSPTTLMNLYGSVGSPVQVPNKL